MKKIKNTKFQIWLPFLMAITLASGLGLGLKLGKNNNRSNPVSSYHKFANILHYINQYYVDTVDTEELVEVAIKEMLLKLDPHSVYIPAKEAELNKPQLTGSFSGIGIEFNILKDTIYVVNALSGGPSEKLGIRTGDRIVEVDDEMVAGIGITNVGVAERLRGKKGTKVKVEIKRKGSKELLVFNITRDKIPTHSVEAAYMIDKKTGYIKVSRFSATTYDEFKEKMAELNAKGMKQLVLDLQNNPGGYMDKAIKMVDEFLKADQMIVFTKGKIKRHNNQFYSTSIGNFENLPLIVLIDEGSASASEIVSGAIQDNDRGLIVGRRSFGKGLVQWPIELNDRSELRLTISRYYTPSGRSIQKPYSDRIEDYYLDFAKRAAHGEFYHADSIQLNDSLRYETAHGRTVYGGGGIMPDYFVPLDTMYSSKYFSRLFNSGVLNEFIIEHYEANEKKFKKMTVEEFLADYEVNDKLLKKLIKKGEKEKIEFDEEGFEKSKRFIQLRIKADFASKAFGRGQFYKVINEINNSLSEALKLFDKAEELTRNDYSQFKEN
ncbi:MAG: S41 family peptidase [Cytophagales bacterium]|nr:S41 family peptidase [Cytophagales bacterium]